MMMDSREPDDKAWDLHGLLVIILHADVKLDPLPSFNNRLLAVRVDDGIEGLRCACVERGEIDRERGCVREREAIQNSYA